MKTVKNTVILSIVKLLPLIDTNFALIYIHRKPQMCQHCGFLCFTGR